MVKFDDRENHNYRTFATQMIRMIRSTLCHPPPGGDDQSVDAVVHNSILHREAAYGDSAAVRPLLAKGVDVEAKDNLGNTALHHAAMAERWVAVDTLLAEGVDIEAKDEFGKTALHHAAIEGRSTGVAMLLTNGADAEETATAEEYIAVLLTRNEELRPFHNQASARMERDDFIAMYQMLLKRYHLDLSRDAVAITERSTIQLLTRLSTERLATLILNLSEPGYEHAADTDLARGNLSGV
ncbi:MAG: hypothetical protein M1825_006343 [Sarcosagium campestre]|nr:MAG: hypothetical protein M1825_006343 [Sarcosagium campestre]